MRSVANSRSLAQNDFVRRSRTFHCRFAKRSEPDGIFKSLQFLSLERRPIAKLAVNCSLRLSVVVPVYGGFLSRFVLACFPGPPANDISATSWNKKRGPRPNERPRRFVILIRTLLCAISVIAGFKKLFFWPQKIFKKVKKKACHALGPSARGELRATNAPVSSFKKNSKK